MLSILESSPPIEIQADSIEIITEIVDTMLIAKPPAEMTGAEADLVLNLLAYSSSDGNNRDQNYEILQNVTQATSFPPGVALTVLDQVATGSEFDSDSSVTFDNVNEIIVRTQDLLTTQTDFCGEEFLFAGETVSYFAFTRSATELGDSDTLVPIYPDGDSEDSSSSVSSFFVLPLFYL